jgi:transcriptional regulator with XRE-family HTH domain
MVDGSPTVRRRRLGLILRGLRERTGMTGEEVGASIERSGSWVSRVETGRVGLRGRDLKDLLDVYGVPEEELRDELLSLAREGKQRGWWSKYADTLMGGYATYIGFESEASELLVYETLVIHGLLQTEEYARALFSAGIQPMSTDGIERKLKIRMERQSILDSGLKLWAIFDESVLYRRIGGPNVLQGQLKHLEDATLRSNVTVQIVPLAAGVFPSISGTFSVVRFHSSDDPDIVYVEGGPAAGDIFAEADDARWYNDVFDHLRAAALSPTESRDLIRQARDAAA